MIQTILFVKVKVNHGKGLIHGAALLKDNINQYESHLNLLTLLKKAGYTSHPPSELTPNKFCICHESSLSENRGPLRGECRIDLSLTGAACHDLPKSPPEREQWRRILQGNAPGTLPMEGIFYEPGSVVAFIVDCPPTRLGAAPTGCGSIN